MYRDPIQEFKRRVNAIQRVNRFNSVTKFILGLIIGYAFFLAWEENSGFEAVAKAGIIHCADMLFFTTDNWVKAALFVAAVCWVRSFIVTQMAQRAVRSMF